MPAVGEWAQRGVIVVPLLRQLWARFVQFLGAMVIPTACNSTSRQQKFFRYFIDFQLEDFAIATLFPQQKHLIH